MAHTRTRAIQRGALAREGLVQRQPRAMSSDAPPRIATIILILILLVPRICTLRHNTYNTVLSGFPGFPIGAADAVSGVLGVGPINAALKRLKLSTVIPGVTSTLSASSAFLSLYRFSDAFSSFLAHAAINLQPPSHTVLYQTPGSRSSAAVL